MSTTRSRNFKSLNAESHTSDTIDVDKDDDSEVSGESLDHFGSKDSEEYSSDDSIGDELAKYYHDDNLLSPKYQTLLAPKHKFSPTNAASLGPSSANKHSHTDASHVSPPTLTTFSLTEAVTDSTTTPAAAPLSLSLPPSPVIPPRKLKNKHKKRQQEEEDDDDDASDDGAAKESLTQVQVSESVCARIVLCHLPTHVSHDHDHDHGLPSFGNALSCPVESCLGVSCLGVVGAKVLRV